jgi:hypothetical protein
MNEDTMHIDDLLADLEQEVTMKVGVQAIAMSVFDELVRGRVYPWGTVTYFHPDRFSHGVYLPSNLGQRVADSLVDLKPLEDLHGRELSRNERKVVATVVGSLVQQGIFSGASDYGVSWITGDIGECRRLCVDGDEREVLVVPQGLRRAKITAEHFAMAGMKEHPLAGDERKVLEAMAKAMGYSNLAVPYHRGKAFADGRNPGVIVGDVRSLYVSTTWDFSPNIADPKMKAPYRLPRVEKMVLESRANAFTGHPGENLKATWRYALRIREHCDAMQHSYEPAGEGRAAKVFSDKLFFAANGLPVDMVYTNVVYCGKDPQRQDGVLMVFPDISAGNYFFQGKTQQTLFELLERFGSEYHIRVMRVQNPQEFADAFGYRNSAHLKGKELSNAVLMDCVDLMLAPGTFRGPQWVHGYKPVDREFKRFDTIGSVVEAADAAITLYNDSVWGINGGVPSDESCIAANPLYCTIFDMQTLRNGHAEPLTFRHLKDI